MKQYILGIMCLLMMGAVFAQSDELTPMDVVMETTGVEYVEYCIDNVNPPDSVVQIKIGKVCRDLDNMSGCSNADELVEDNELLVTPMGDIIAQEGEGCAWIELQTNDALGLYYYVVNGKIGEARVTRETGGVTAIPEMGTLAAMGMIGILGMFIYSKRR